MIAALVRGHLARGMALAIALLGAATLREAWNVNALLATAAMVLAATPTISPRSDAFELQLPGRGRDFAMAHALAALALVLGPMLVWLAPWTHGAASRDPFAPLELLLLATFAVVTPVALHRGRPGEWSLVPTLMTLTVATIVTLLVTPPVATLAFALGAAAALVVVWFAVPDSIGSQDGNLSDRDVLRASRWSHPLWSLFRDSLPVPALAMCALAVPLTMIGSGLATFCLAVLSIPVAVRAHMLRLETLYHSHRARLLALVVPAVILPACCVALGNILDDARVPRAEPLRERPIPTRQLLSPAASTDVRADHWRRAPAGTAPVITAPWGEHIVADTATVLGVHLYNPWTSSHESSARFVDWQLARATAEVYGRPLTLAQLDAGERPPRRPGGARTWMVYAAAALTLGILLLWIVEVGDTRRRRARLAPSLAIWAATLPVLAVFYLDATHLVRGRTVVVPLLHRALREVAAALPANPALALLLAVVPVAGAWLLLEWQFARSETMRDAVRIHDCPSGQPG